MSSPGLSLCGFMDPPQAYKHLKTVCVLDDPCEAKLTAQFRAAKAKLGGRVANAGKPRIEAIPDKHRGYLKQLTAEPWVAMLMKGPMKGATFKMIEIDPLLAYQYTVDTARSDRICTPLGKAPSIEEMLEICLQRESLGRT